LFWLSDEAWAAIEPQLPKNQPGARRVDDRRVISGIVHVLKSGCRWRDCPSVYGPRTTIYNRFNRWSRRRIWQRIFQALVEAGWIDATVAIDSTYVKAHRSSHGGKGGRGRAIGLSRGGQTTKIHVLTDVLGRPAVIRLTPGNVSDIRIADELIEAAGPVRRLIADRGYDANRLRRTLRSVGTVPVIPGRRSRKRPIRHDERRYRDRWRIEAAFCRLKDFRRVATRYDKLALNFLSAVVLATIIAFWV
ncbi:MAG: IS5 family transposase, partial [Gammaproteobacteria bacterium]